MNNELYVIGNGFDLHHGLNTSYKAFAKYLKENDTDLYETLENYISYPETDDDLWWKFEENLANLNADEILSESSDYLPNIASDDFRDRDLHTFPDIMQQKFERLTIDLLENFKKFILDAKFHDGVYQHKVILNSEAKFLNFNYTNTLEKVYNINFHNITYIHNSIHYHENIVLGHGIDPKNFEKQLPEPPDNLDFEDYEEWYRMHDDYDYSYDTGRENLYEYFKIMHKSTAKIIENHKTFFNNLKNINEVFIFGHSISKVDILYFEKLKESVSQSSKWIVSYYSDTSILSLKESLLSIGITEENISFIKLTEIQ
ncbi:hypothetical protein AS589_17835 [Empedobacter brevis]|uniref:bacteriophage abortive infection AbiH family protein n=1 Tax=Empedobacter brevis TaxID=247 RepID=UPI00131FF9DD|nr:bacteriophage abortive infection AbiH family protein [Empedobacter brevis]QHC86505.1 hypothetical protein AS589_17835 [Empedobacter brevis]